MTYNPTNANDVELIVSKVERSESGSRTGSSNIAQTSKVVVDDFSIGSDEDLEGLSGCGNPEALGVSQGDVDHTFSFTIQGEYAKLFKGLAADNGRANELEIIVRMDDYMDKLTGARAGTRDLSGSSGDAMEYEASGIATGRPNGDNTTSNSS